ncbi:MAG: glycosyltransferase family 2 protein [Candidatus Electrothrix sp. AW5]|nr:glycosyltransferase family 2 protein [Candidatus Electrothrix gigas]
MESSLRRTKIIYFPLIDTLFTLFDMHIEKTVILISVVIPMYNAKKTIAKCIDSVLSQTYQGEMELIVINDGSSDGCEKTVQEYISSNKTSIPIKLINKKNGGVSSARNMGIREAAGEWIALLDSDDIWYPEKLEKQVNEINLNETIKFIGTNRDKDPYPYFGKSKNKLYTLNAEEVIAKWYPHTSTALINKKILIESGMYNEKRTHAEDGDLWLRILMHCDYLYVLREVLVDTGGGKRSFGDTGLSADMHKMYQGELEIIKGAKKRRQINSFHFFCFYLFLSCKYLRRKIIIGLS